MAAPEDLSTAEVDRRIEEMSGSLARSDATIEYLLESLAELELAADDVGYRKLAALATQEFSDAGLRRIVTSCQLMAIKSPLIKRGLGLRAAYTWAQGVEIAAVDPRVDVVVQGFLEDKENRRSLTSPQARVAKDIASGTDGNLFLALFTRPTTGRVTVRSLPFMEIVETIPDPEDRSVPWFYLHEVTTTSLDPATGATRPLLQRTWYPALGDPVGRPKLPRIRDIGVRWDAPVLHMAEDRPEGWQYGVPPAYAAIDWARAYKDFLTDLATLARALSRFAWRQTGPGRKQAAARAAIAGPPTLDPATGEPQFAGATAMMGLDQRLEAIPKSGAMIDKDTGNPLVNMVAAAFGLPITMLLGDPSRGDRSAADNLDRPTELGMELRQAWWADGYRQILDHVIDSAAMATRGKPGRLRGKWVTDDDDRRTVELLNGRDRSVRITFPELDDITPAAFVDAIVKADQTGKVHPFVILRLLVKALGIPDADEALALVTGPGGEFVPPPGAGAPGNGGASQPAVNPNDPAPDQPKPAPSPAKDPAKVAAGKDTATSTPDAP